LAEFKESEPFPLSFTLADFGAWLITAC